MWRPSILLSPSLRPRARRPARRAGTRPQLEALENQQTSGSHQTDPVAGVGGGNAPPVVAFSHTRNTLTQSLTAPESNPMGGPARGIATSTSQTGSDAVFFSATTLSGSFAPVALSGRTVSSSDKLSPDSAPAFAGVPAAVGSAWQDLLPTRSDQSQLLSRSSADAAVVDVLLQDYFSSE
jgi:hypothetical protein